MRIECLDYIKFLKSIQNESVDLAITDPPYGISYQNNYTHNKHEIIKGDDKIFDYTSLAKELYRVLKEDTAVYCFTCWSEYPHHYKEFESAGFIMKEPLIVQKRASGKTDLYGSFQTNSEWILFGHKGRFKFRQTELVRNKRAGTIPNKGRKPVPEF